MKPEERNECKNVREFQERFATGEFENGCFDKQCEAGWYDWFCSDSALAGKTKRLGKVVAQIKDGGKVDLDNCQMCFKNNCPMVGPLYDDIRIGDDEGNLFVISVDDERCEHKWTVYSYLADYGVIAEFDDVRNLVKWLNEPWEKPFALLKADMLRNEAERTSAVVRDYVRAGDFEMAERLRQKVRETYERIDALEKEAENAQG